MKVITQSKETEGAWEAGISLMVLFHGLFLGLQSSFFEWQTDPSSGPKSTAFRFYSQSQSHKRKVMM